MLCIRCLFLSITKMPLIRKLVLSVLLSILAVSAFSKEDINPAQCDLRAEHPRDVGRTGDGVAMADLKQEAVGAISACLPVASEDALDPNGKYAFQLSRAYHAASDENNRMYWLNVAAKKGWRRALYRRGLILKAQDTATKEQLSLAAIDLEKSGQDYPQAYLYAAQLYWIKLGGFSHNQDKIFDLVQSGYFGGAEEAHYYMSLIAINGDIRVGPYELLFHLARTIENEVQVSWAKNAIAKHGLEFLDPNYSDAVALKSFVLNGEFPELQDFVENRRLTMIKWAQEAIRNPSNEGMSIDQKIDSAFDLLPIAIDFSETHEGQGGVAILTDTINILCSFVLDDDSDIIDEGDFCPTLFDAVFAYRSAMMELGQNTEQYLSDGSMLKNIAGISRYEDCTTNIELQVRHDGDLQYSGVNICPVPILVHIAVWSDLKWRNPIYYYREKASEDSTFSFRLLVQDSHMIGYRGKYYAESTSCHTQDHNAAIRREMIEKGTGSIRCRGFDGATVLENSDAYIDMVSITERLMEAISK